MKSANNKPFLTSAAISLFIVLIGYFILIHPKSGDIDKDIKKIGNIADGLKGLGSENGMTYEQLKEKYRNREIELQELQNSIAEMISFRFSREFDVAIHPQPGPDFPILRNEIISEIRDTYPGFPFDDSMGFAELPRGDFELFRDRYIRLAVCKRLLTILGEADVDSVLDFNHSELVEIRDEEAKLNIYKKIIFVSFSGRMESIMNALKELSTPGKYLRIESISIHPTKNGYSLACDLQVSMMTIAFDTQPDEYTQPEASPTPFSIKTPSPVMTPTPIAPTKKAPVPTAGSTTPKPTRRKVNPIG